MSFTIRFITGGAFCLITSNVVAAAPAEYNQMMSLITQFAKVNCEEVQQSGDASTKKVSASVDAGVSGLMKRFAKAGGSGRIDDEIRRYSGLIRSQLPTALNDVRTCKQHIIDVLAPRLLGDASEVGTDKTGCQVTIEGGQIYGNGGDGIRSQGAGLCANDVSIHHNGGNGMTLGPAPPPRPTK